MKLICEMVETVSGLVVENVQGKKTHIIEGIFMQSNVKNRNGRIYPRSMMESEVNRYINEMVTTKRALGELGHPEGPSINMHLASHLITELRQEGDNFVGKAKILDTPNGRIVVGLIEGGVNFGVSSRGLGVLKQNSQGINEVSNYRIATAADIVADPSAPNAFVQGIMEGANWVYDATDNSYRMAEVVESIQTQLHQVRPSRLTEEQKLVQFQRFMNSLNETTRFSK